MEPGHNAQALLLSQRDEQLEALVAEELDQTADLKPTQKGLDLRPLLRTIRRNAPLVISLTIVVTLANALLGLRTPRTYLGGFRLLVEPITSEAKLTDPTALSRGGDISTFTVDYPTLLQVLQSPTLLSKVAKRVQQRYPEVTSDSLNKDLTAQNLVIKRLGNNLTDFTKLIDVSYQGEDPPKVQFILDALAQEYLNYSLEARKSRISGGVEFIENQMPGLQQRVDNLQQQLQALQQRYNLTDPNKQGSDLVEESLVLEKQRLNAQRELREQGTLYATLQRQLRLTPNEAIAASVLSQDPRYQDLLSQLKKVESEIAVKSVRFSEESPVVQSLREQQRKLSGLLGQETQRIVGQSLPASAVNPQILTYQNSTRLDLIKQLADAANQVQVLAVRNQAVTQAESLNADRIRQIPAIIRQYSDLQRQLEISVKTLNSLATQRDTLRVEAAQKEVPWQLVYEPKLPVDANGNPVPEARELVKKLPLGLVGGLLLGIVSAVLLEKRRNIFYGAEDIQDALKLPVLSVIPHHKQAPLGYDGLLRNGLLEIPATATGVSSFEESFNALFASLRFLGASRPRSLVVGSAAFGDGKTTIALHLAQAGAAMGQKVLLVDADFRMPQLHVRLELPNLKGLADLLAQNLEPMDCIQRSPLTENLFILTAGNLSAESPRQLASNRMQQLAAQFKAGFDLVIYDTPHLLGLADTHFLTAYTDGLLFVVGIHQTKRSEVLQTLSSLQDFQLPVLGVVPNHPEKG